MEKKMEKKTYWVQVRESSLEHDELLDSFSQVLHDMGISVWNDEDEAESRGVDLHIWLEDKRS